MCEDSGRETLQDRLGYRFKDPDLLEQALTHRSFTHEGDRNGRSDYERLEFLGDSLLGMLVSDRLYKDDASASEGVLTRRKQMVVNTDSLAAASLELKLGTEIRFGRGEEMSGGSHKDSILADTFEAVLGAVYLDGGIRAARSFVRRHLAECIRAANLVDHVSLDYKTRLQELAQAKLRVTPVYRIVDSSGPDHARKFRSEVLLGEKVMGTGAGSSRKRAEQEAARSALLSLQEQE